MRADEFIDSSLFIAQRLSRRTDLNSSAVGQNDFGRNDMIGSGPVNWNTCAGRIVRDHAADGRARAGRNVGTETKPVRFEKRVYLIEHNAGADTDAAIVDVEIVDLAIVAREIDDQSFADGVPDQAGAGPARSDGNVFIGRGFDDCTRFLRAGGKGYSERLNLINGSVSGVKLASEIIATYVAS